MTNSHNKSSGDSQNGKSSERFFQSNSPPQAGQQQFYQNNSQQYQQMNNKSRSSRVQKSPTSKYFNSISAASNPIPINRGHHQHQQFNNSNHNRYDLNSHHHNSTNHGSHSRSHNSFFMKNMSTRSSPGGSCSPPNFSHFAGSKCYDAPTADNLPQPPSHWTKTSLSLLNASAKSCAAQVNEKCFDDYSMNLKMILNVQA